MKNRVGKILLLLLILFSVNLFSQEPEDYNQVNKKFEYLFYSSVEIEDSLQALNELIEEYSSVQGFENLALTYSAGAKALEGKHAFWPFTKLARINESMEIFKGVLRKDSLNLTTRFMRFSILHHLPAILGYNDEKKADADTIVNLLLEKDYSLIDRQVQEGMVQFMLDSERLSEEQEEDLKNNFSFLVQNE